MCLQSIYLRRHLSLHADNYSERVAPLLQQSNSVPHELIHEALVLHAIRKVCSSIRNVAEILKSAFVAVVLGEIVKKMAFSFVSKANLTRARKGVLQCLRAHPILVIEVLVPTVE